MGTTTRKLEGIEVEIEAAGLVKAGLSLFLESPDSRRTYRGGLRAPQVGLVS